MKAKNLKILQDNNIKVPKFITVIDETNLDLSFSKSKLFSVRSSCILEDDKNQSFAGQFETLLNVKREDVKSAVKQVKESYNKALNYKDIKFLDQQKIKESPVIIQEMINSDMSGVMFTANPLGILNEIVITIGYGLGCNIVDNKVDTTTYHYNIDDMIYCINKKENTPQLKEDELKKLIDLGKQIENIFNNKMDIEFAIFNNEIYILQARPITTINKNNIICLDNSNIVESYPEVSLPLTQDFVKDVYYRIFKALLIRLTDNSNCIQKLDLKNMVDIVNGRFYYRINNWYSVLKLLPCQNIIIKIWQKMLGVANKNITQDKFNVSILVKLKVIKNFIKYLRKTPKEMDLLEIFFKEKIKEYNNILNKSKTIEELLNLYNKAKEDIISQWDITLVNDMYAFIYTYLSREKSSDIENLESFRYLENINDLVKSYKEKSDNFLNLFNNFIDIYGDRVLEELKLETKTYRTNPELLLEYIKNQEQINLSKKTNTNSSYFMKKAKIGIANREKSRMNRSRLFGLTRSIFLKIGEILVNQNKIEKERDIFYLFENEIKAYKTSNLKSIVDKRKIEYENYKSMIGYNRIIFYGEVINTIPYLIQKYNLFNNILQGEGISEGTAEGKVIIINKPNTNIDVTNKIIVTKTTDPGWSLLIKNSLGIITEQGSLLSHTAIISRELHKPAIVNFKNATNLFKNDEIIEMNGTTGKVEIKNG